MGGSTSRSKDLRVDIQGRSIPSEHWSNVEDENICQCDCPNVNVENDTMGMGDGDGDEKMIDHEMDGWSMCSIARRARDEYIFSEEVYDHLHAYSHGIRIKCRYNSECHALLRCESNVDFRWDDLCHLLIFKHPPRRNKIVEMMNGYNPMSLNEDGRRVGCFMKTQQIHPLMGYDTLSDHVPFLLIEVIENGFGLDLVLKKDDDQEMMKGKLMLFSQILKQKLNEMQTQEELDSYLREYPIPHRLLDDIDMSLISIMKIVKKKLNHQRHLNITDEMHEIFGYHKRLNHGEMLSLILYSGCDCNYDLCANMRSDDQKGILDPTISLKWKIFEFCLDMGIEKLHFNDTLYPKSVPVYSGIGKVLLNRDLIHQVDSSDYGVQFSSFISTSRSISVAKKFRGNNGGMIFRIQPHLQRRLLRCCDISWISKFPDEQEVLVSFHSAFNKWKLSDVSTFMVTNEDGQETQEQFFDLVNPSSYQSSRMNQWLMSAGYDKSRAEGQWMSSKHTPYHPY